MRRRAYCMGRNGCITGAEMIQIPLYLHPLPRLLHFHPDLICGSAAGYGPDDQEGLGAGNHRVRQRSSKRFMGIIPCTGKKPHQWPALPGGMVTDGPAQHRKAIFERIKHGTQGNWCPDLQFHFSAGMRQYAQMMGQYHPDHGSV